MLDVVCIIDSRFVGGTAAALACDIEAFLAAGLQVGLIEVRSSYLDGPPTERSRVMQGVVADERLTVMLAEEANGVSAKVAFLHHPMTFFFGLEQRCRIRAERAFLVAHHLPFRGDGSLQYDPVVTTRRAERDTGVRPAWAPVSGLCRDQLLAFAPLVRVSSEDWPNAFDTDAWTPKRRVFENAHIAIGRHGRADLLKWPLTANGIRASLPALPDSSVHVMGCPTTAFQQLGVDTSTWNILAFDAEPVAAFLERLDVFIYHFHPQSSESFGRTVAEAMLMGCVCILDPRLEATFGDLALYCAPQDTADVLQRLRDDPAGARTLADRAQNAMRTRHNKTAIPARLDVFAADGGVTRGQGARFASPLAVMRKTIGMMRRGEYFESQLANRH